MAADGGDQLAKIAIGISLFSVVQTWGIAYYNKHGFVGRIDTMVDADAQLLFGPQGPAIGPTITMRATGRDYFVTSIDGWVKRKADGATHDLRWVGYVVVPENDGLSRPLGFSLNRNTEKALQVALADSVTAGLVVAQMERVRGVAERVRADYVRETYGDDPPMDLDDDELEVVQSGVDADREVLDAFGRIQRLCYWEPGEYVFGINIVTSRPDKTFSLIRTFVVSDEDADAIRVNAVPVVQLAQNRMGYLSSRSITLSEGESE